MPEIITKYPEIVLKVLRDTGAKCSEGAPQRILRQCPPERFCSLPTGELCVYGLNELSLMTQIKTEDISEITQRSAPIFTSKVSFLIGSALLIGIVIGVVFGRFIKRQNKITDSS